MTDRWYDLAAPNASLTQGDLIFDCPVLTWQTGAYFSQEGTHEPEILKNTVDDISVDVIVMSQACDLEQCRVDNVTMLNSGQVEDLSIGVRIFYFHEVFTVPHIFLESLLVHRGKPRFRLLPPNREHLSQAIARFFMRVGLPPPIETPWQP